MRTPIEKYFHAIFPDPLWANNPDMEGNIVPMTDLELDAMIIWLSVMEKKPGGRFTVAERMCFPEEYYASIFK